ncbi:uncharacterized protein [Montipora capricornis]|uniref:uncharacterized protein n=1 Tax=Montipora capricornis TaxID=246305 RepID=UPI0035F137E0
MVLSCTAAVMPSLLEMNSTIHEDSVTTTSSQNSEDAVLYGISFGSAVFVGALAVFFIYIWRKKRTARSRRRKSEVSFTEAHAHHQRHSDRDEGLSKNELSFTDIQMKFLPPLTANDLQMHSSFSSMASQSSEGQNEQLATGKHSTESSSKGVAGDEYYQESADRTEEKGREASSETLFEVVSDLSHQISLKEFEVPSIEPIHLQLSSDINDPPDDSKYTDVMSLPSFNVIQPEMSSKRLSSAIETPSDDEKGSDLQSSKDMSSKYHGIDKPSSKTTHPEMNSSSSSRESELSEERTTQKSTSEESTDHKLAGQIIRDKMLGQIRPFPRVLECNAVVTSSEETQSGDEKDIHSQSSTKMTSNLSGLLELSHSTLSSSWSDKSSSKTSHPEVSTSSSSYENELSAEPNAQVSTSEQSTDHKLYAQISPMNPAGVSANETSSEGEEDSDSHSSKDMASDLSGILEHSQSTLSSSSSDRSSSKTSHAEISSTTSSRSKSELSSEAATQESTIDKILYQAESSPHVLECHAAEASTACSSISSHKPSTVHLTPSGLRTALPGSFPSSTPYQFCRDVDSDNYFSDGGVEQGHEICGNRQRRSGTFQSQYLPVSHAESSSRSDIGSFSFSTSTRERLQPMFRMSFSGCTSQLSSTESLSLVRLRRAFSESFTFLPSLPSHFCDSALDLATTGELETTSLESATFHEPAERNLESIIVE